MKRFLWVVLSVFLFQGTALAATYNVDADASSVRWAATKVGGQHDGGVKVQSGQIQFEEGVLKGGNLVIDMQSITVRDIENPTYNKKLVDHLNSADFFDVQKHPVASIEITSAETTDSGAYKLKGIFKIKDKTAELPFDATIVESEGKLQAQAIISLDRTLFDVRYGSGKFFQNLGDKLIHDDFMLEVNVEATS